MGVNILMGAIFEPIGPLFSHPNARSRIVSGGAHNIEITAKRQQIEQNFVLGSREWIFQIEHKITFDFFFSLSDEDAAFRRILSLGGRSCVVSDERLPMSFRYWIR